MARLYYDPRDFGLQEPATLRRGDRLEFPFAEFVHAAVTVGRRNRGQLFRHGVSSMHELWWRSSMIYANVLTQWGGYMARSDAFKDLDPSEKGAVTYFLGLAVAKLLAARLLSVPWLVHLDRVVHTLGIRLSGRSRPDLIGYGHSRGWIVVEAKGRSSKLPQGLLQRSKTQTRWVDIPRRDAQNRTFCR